MSSSTNTQNHNGTPNHNDTPNHDGTHRGARRWAIVATLAVGSLALCTACSDDQLRALGEEDVRSSLANRVTTAVESAGLELDGDLDCIATIGSDDGAVAAECTGTTTTGDTVSGTYTGTADVEAETCTAGLVTKIGDEPATDEPDADCFSVAEM